MYKQKLKIKAIAAYGKNREIGIQSRLPWNIPEDMKRFRSWTQGHAVLLGRKNFNSLKNKPLPGRPHWVVSRHATNQPAVPGVVWVSSVEEGFESILKAGHTLVWVIGGGDIYHLCMPYCDELVLTEIERAYPGSDAFFPEWPKDQFKATAIEERIATELEGLHYRFTIYERISSFTGVNNAV